MAADGSIVIAAKMNVGQAEKDLAKLKGKIEKTENDIADITKKRDAASEKGALGAEQLEKEKQKLIELKKQLAEVKAVAKDKTYSFGIREEASQMIPELQTQVQEQQRLVSTTRSEWRSANKAVDRYNEQIAGANGKLEQQKSEAGQLTDNIEAAKQAQRGFGAATEVAGEFADRLGKRIQRLASRVFVFTMITAALRSLRTWLGNVINTNDEARAAIARLQGALLTLAQPLVQVIIPAFTAFVNLLAAIVSRIAQFVSMIFGTTVKDSAKAAKGLNATAKGYGSVAKQAEKAAKSLAGFDEIEQLQAPEEADTGGGGGGGGLGDIAPDFGFLDGVTDKLKRIADLVLMIAAAFALWKIGEKIGGPLGEILKILAGTILIATGITLLIDNINSILDGKYKNVSKESFIKTVFGGALVGLGLVAMGASAWALPIAIIMSFAITDIVVNWESIKEMWQSILDGIGALFTGDVDTFWQKISEALFTWTGMDSWSVKITEWIVDAIWGEGTFQQAIDYLQNGGTVDAVFEYMWQKIQEAFSGIGDWFTENVVSPILGRFSYIKENGPPIFSEALENIETIWSESSEWFSKHVSEPIKQVFKGINTYISGTFSGDFKRAWNGVKDIFKGIWNANVALFEGAVNLIVQGLNWLVDKINSISFTVPSWVPVVGGKSLSPNISHIPAVTIPRLAQGAVIPANREFLAVLGDQKSGTNIEAPLSTIQDAVRLEMEPYIDAMMAGFESVVSAIQNKDSAVYIGDESIGRAATRYQNKMKFIRGGNY